MCCLLFSQVQMSLRYGDAGPVLRCCQVGCDDSVAGQPMLPLTIGTFLQFFVPQFPTLKVEMVTLIFKDFC
jgi:hypothetical protein